MRLLFNWYISFRRLYFKSSRVEYQIRLWRRVKYHRPEHPMKGQTGETVSGYAVTDILSEDSATTNIEEEK